MLSFGPKGHPFLKPGPFGPGNRLPKNDPEAQRAGRSNPTHMMKKLTFDIGDDHAEFGLLY